MNTPQAGNRLIILAITILVVVGVLVYRKSTIEQQNSEAPKQETLNTEDVEQITTPLEEGRDEKTQEQDQKNDSTAIPRSVLIPNVPFTSQAPFAHWENPIYQDACEEAAILMASAWYHEEELTKQNAEETLEAIAQFEEEMIGQYHDTSAADTVKVAQAYFSDTPFLVKENATLKDIETQLANGSLVIIPAIGTELQNPNFTAPGPLRHMLLIRGYDQQNQEFITNDAGTRNGELFRYPYTNIERAWTDYPTGYHIPIVSIQHTMIVLPSPSISKTENVKN